MKNEKLWSLKIPIKKSPKDKEMEKFFEICKNCNCLNYRNDYKLENVDNCLNVLSCLMTAVYIAVIQTLRAFRRAVLVDVLEVSKV